MEVLDDPCVVYIDTQDCLFKTVEAQKTIVDVETDEVRVTPSRFHCSYQLPAPLNFSTRHFVRLANWIPTNKQTTRFAVAADFLAPQIFRTSFEPFLGLCISGAQNNWLPVPNNTVPAFGVLTFTPLDKSTKVERFTVQGILVLYFAPATHVEKGSREHGRAHQYTLF